MAQPDFSEQAIRNHCPHCDPSSHSFEYPLEPPTDEFHLVCDSNSVVEGHLLIIPKQHISCIGEYSDELLAKFKLLHEKVSSFIRDEYGPVALFEHGKLSQSVFHSHIHYLPYRGDPDDIIPEGKQRMHKLTRIDDLRSIYRHDGGYLFFGIGSEMWTVDPKLATPGFFRYRFADALGVPERGNWKAMREDPLIMKTVEDMCRRVQQKWHHHFGEN